MFERFTKDARAVVNAAHDEAVALGARQIEAEHLLLALAARGVAGLDHDEVAEALTDEERSTLGAVGVRLDDFDVTPATGSVATKLRFGASAKTALERTLKVAIEHGDRRIAAPHILLALLWARHGRVPRALTLAGIDTIALAARARAEL